MVVVEYLYEDMKKLVNLPLNKVIDGLNNLGAPSEYNEEAKAIVSEITPNRPDWYSVHGLARSVLEYYKKDKKSYKAKKSNYVVNVENTIDSWPYAVCAVVKGLKFDDEKITEIIHLQEKIGLTFLRHRKKGGPGLYPLEKIAFPVKFTAEEPEKIRYRPLEYPSAISGKEILEKHPTGIKYKHLVGGWKKLPIFIDSKGQIMSMPPIVNSHDVGKITESTGEVFVEVTGPNFDTISTALNIFVAALADMGGEVYEVRVNYGKRTVALPDLSQKKMKINLAKINKVLGTKLTEKEVKELLSQMGYGYAKGVAETPPYRADVMGEIDIIEDIAIAYGYNSFAPTLPDFFHPGGYNKKYEKFDDAMCGMGFLETKTFVLTNKDKLVRVGYRGKVIEVTNPASEDYNIIRPTPLGDFLDVFVGNKMKKLPQKNYEIGLSYIEKTEKHLIFGMMDKSIEFSEFRGYLQRVMSECGLSFSLSKKKNELLDDDFSSEIIVNGKVNGLFGKVSKKILEKFGIEFDVYICQFNLDEL
ncbi:phenylalanine--tRNA ligase subunit beta [Candidatus Micrarchaeota archaeon]|nr:phenylalanine--tRNA ligase subunit beta [Candidatus Micrarchaeota archaeon]